MKKIIRLGMTVEAAMTLVGRIKRLFQSRRLPDRAQQKEAEKRAWKELNRGIAREESRLKAMISRRQSLLSGAARWKKTALNALKADKIELAREALKQEEKILREIRELAGNPESAMEDLHRLKGSLAELAGQGSPRRRPERGSQPARNRCLQNPPEGKDPRGGRSSPGQERSLPYRPAVGTRSPVKRTSAGNTERKLRRQLLEEGSLEEK